MCIFDKNFNNRYFITLEITLIHTVEIEDNKYFLNNIMDKVIPKSEKKFLESFFYTFRLEEAFVSSSMIRKHYKSVI